MKTKWMATAALAAILLTGCSSHDEAPAAEEFAAEAPAPTPTAIETNVPSTGAVTMFGDSSQLSEGVTATVTAAGFRNVGTEEVAVFEVRVDNTSSAQLEAGAVTASVTYGPGLLALEAVADESIGLGGSFGAILPGESASVLVGVKATRSQSTNLNVSVAGPAGDPSVFVGPFPDGQL